MESFEQVLDQYTPMIHSVLKKARIYKNHDYYKHCATIALWNAWKNYEPSIGPFAPYAYRTMLTTIYQEMTKENSHTTHYISYDKEKLTFLAQHIESKNHHPCCSDLFIQLESLITKEERELLIDLYYYQYKYEELSIKYGVSIYALKKRRDRLIKKLREELS